MAGSSAVVVHWRWCVIGSRAKKREAGVGGGWSRLLGVRHAGRELWRASLVQKSPEKQKGPIDGCLGAYLSSRFLGLRANAADVVKKNC